jgi:hypothetical protein
LQTPFDLGDQVFGEAQVMERLLHDRSGVLRLATVTLKALLGFEAATLAVFGVFFCVSCVGDSSAPNRGAVTL